MYFLYPMVVNYTVFRHQIKYFRLTSSLQGTLTNFVMNHF